MKALIHDARVCQIANEEFPVAHPLRWIDCDDSVTTKHTFDGTQFVPPKPHPSAAWDGEKWVRDEAAGERERIDAEIRALEAGQEARTLRAAILGDPVALAKLRAIEDAIVPKRAARPK